MPIRNLTLTTFIAWLAGIFALLALAFKVVTALIGIGNLPDDARTALGGYLHALILVASLPWWVLAIIALIPLILQLYSIFRVNNFLATARNYSSRLEAQETKTESYEKRLGELSNAFHEAVHLESRRLRDLIVKLHDAMGFMKVASDLEGRIQRLKSQGATPPPPQGWETWKAEQELLHQAVEFACRDRDPSNWVRGTLYLVQARPPGVDDETIIRAYGILLSDEHRLAAVKSRIDAAFFIQPSERG